MKKENIKRFYASVCLLTAFVLWTAAVCFMDIGAIGAQGSLVGLAGLNGFVHELIGVNMFLYTVTDWLGLIPAGFAFGFALLGIVQWIKRKNVLKVDRSILALGVFYIAVMAAYAFFEMFEVNYRPVLINGCLETSYPSSTTMLAMCVMPTAAMQFRERIKNRTIKKCIVIPINLFTVFMVVGRLVSGVHWITDIIGGVLLSAGLVMMYRFAAYGKTTGK